MEDIMENTENTKKTKTARKPNAAFMKTMTPSADLAAVIGNNPVARTEAVKPQKKVHRARASQPPRNLRSS